MSESKTKRAQCKSCLNYRKVLATGLCIACHENKKIDTCVVCGKKVDRGNRILTMSPNERPEAFCIDCYRQETGQPQKKLGRICPDCGREHGGQKSLCVDCKISNKKMSGISWYACDKLFDGLHKNLIDNNTNKPRACRDCGRFETMGHRIDFLSFSLCGNCFKKRFFVRGNDRVTESQIQGLKKIADMLNS